MERRARRGEDRLPPIVVEGTNGVGEGMRARSTVVELGPPGSRVARRLLDAAKRARVVYDIRIGTHRGCDPRVRSVVEHRLHQRAADVVDVLCRDDELTLSLGALTLHGDPRSTSYDAFEHEYRLPTDLHLAWSWPDLPMWLAVGEVSTGRCALRLSLRSRRRLRYPARYFDAAHAVLSKLESQLVELR